MRQWSVWCYPEKHADLNHGHSDSRWSNTRRLHWCIDGNKFTVWVDACSLAMKVALGVNGAIIEDDCWLWPENDARHINLAELDAILKGINLALQWQARVLHIDTDSVYTHQWITFALTRKTWLTTKASSEMLMQKWLAALAKTIKEYNLFVDIALIRSAMNRADALTRVPQWWLTRALKESKPLQQLCATIVHSLDSEWIISIHRQCGHPGIKRTLNLARMVNPVTD